MARGAQSVKERTTAPPASSADRAGSEGSGEERRRSGDRWWPRRKCFQRQGIGSDVARPIGADTDQRTEREEFVRPGRGGEQEAKGDADGTIDVVVAGSLGRRGWRLTRLRVVVATVGDVGTRNVLIRLVMSARRTAHVDVVRLSVERIENAASSEEEDDRGPDDQQSLHAAESRSGELVASTHKFEAAAQLPTLFAPGT